MASPFVYLPGAVLSRAELLAACLDGHLVPLGEGYIPADLVETPGLRAASLSGVLGVDLAATHLTAAWVRGAIDEPPPRLTVQRAVARRLPHVRDRRLHYRDGTVEPDDLETLSGVAVTSTARTVADLARMPGDGYEAALVSWVRREPDALASGRGWLAARPRLPHRRRAESVLQRVQEEVTRYTS